MNRRNYIVLDLVRSEKYNLNPTESILVSYLFGLINQYDPIPYNGKWYYMADYEYIINNCPILPNKVDTLRRLYKRLENIGLIELIRLDNHVCFNPSLDFREWGLECKSVGTEKNPVGTEKNPVGTEKNPFTPYISIIDNNIDNINNIASQKDFASKNTTKGTLFPDEGKKEEPKEKVTLFRNSEVYKLVKCDTDGNPIDYSKFEKKFNTSEFSPVDMIYYFHLVSDWSDQKNMKRTKNGWMATIRNFIRGDVERKKLHLKPEFKEGKPEFDVKGALDYLNGYE